MTRTPVLFLLPILGLFGVNVWSDHEYGASFATVLVYLHGELIFKTEPTKVVNHDMWAVADIDWPAATVTPLTNAALGPAITHNYFSPYFFQP